MMTFDSHFEISGNSFSLTLKSSSQSCNKSVAQIRCYLPFTIKKKIRETYFVQTIFYKLILTEVPVYELTKQIKYSLALNPANTNLSWKQ